MYNSGCYIGGEVEKETFPDKFSNQVYISDRVVNFNFEYESVYSVKFLISGKENYEIDGKVFSLTSEEYLVINNNQKVVCDSPFSEKAISIFIDPGIIKDVFHNCNASDEKLLDYPHPGSEEIIFYEKVFPLEDNLLVNKLLKLNRLFFNEKLPTESLGTEFYYDAAKDLILSQKKILKEIRRIDCVKTSTRKELYDRMFKMKEFIIENWEKTLSVDDLAAEAFMSPYHFHRVFTSTFGISPIKFHTSVKMKKIKQLLLSGKESITDLAELSGYSDIFSFSKAFKKHFGFAPSRYSCISG